VTIIDQIVSKIDNFYRHYGKPPKYLYLGYEDMDEFKRETDYLIVGTTKPEERRSFHGLLIYEVDAEHHINVSMES